MPSRRTALNGKKKIKGIYFRSIHALIFCMTTFLYIKIEIYLIYINTDSLINLKMKNYNLEYIGTCLETRPTNLPIKCGLKRQLFHQDRFNLKGLINQVVNSECGTSAQTTGGLSRECSLKTGSTVF